MKGNFPSFFSPHIVCAHFVHALRTHFGIISAFLRRAPRAPRRGDFFVAKEDNTLETTEEKAFARNIHHTRGGGEKIGPKSFEYSRNIIIIIITVKEGIRDGIY